jgi:hypothetical protein
MSGLFDLSLVKNISLESSRSTKMMTTPSGAICAEAESKMCKFLIITATVATVTLAALIAGVSLTKALSSADFAPPPSAAGVAGGGAGVGPGEPPASVPACWDDKRPAHCHA